MWLAIALLVAFGLAAVVVIGGGDSDRFGLVNEIVGGIVVGAVFVAYEVRRQRNERLQREIGTGRQILSVIAEPGQNLMDAAAAVPTDFESQVDPKRGTLPTDTSRLITNCRNALHVYRTHALTLRGLTDNDQTLDRGSEMVLLLIRHLVYLEHLDMGAVDSLSTRNSPANRSRLLDDYVARTIDEYRGLVASIRTHQGSEETPAG